jgi:hypothetical protein
MKTIAAKMELHQNFPSDETRFKLAVNEAKLISDADAATQNIIAIRKASIAALESAHDGSSQRQQVVASLRHALQEAGSWAKEYSRFMTEIGRLYESANAEIAGLPLTNSARLEAQLELERIILDSVGRAASTDPTQ